MGLVELLMGIRIFFLFLLRETLPKRTILTHHEVSFSTENLEKTEEKIIGKVSLIFRRKLLPRRTKNSIGIKGTNLILMPQFLISWRLSILSMSVNNFLQSLVFLMIRPEPTQLLW